jgi:heterodisulfide reductase subunit C
MMLMSEERVDLTGSALDRGFIDDLTPAGETLRNCMQCGSCTATCASSYAMDYTPRQLWHMARLGLRDEVLTSKTLWLCSTCYSCTLRCPRDLPLTETIGTLKRLAVQHGIPQYKESHYFYRAFMETVRRYGRTDEIEIMVRYFLTTNPLLALDYVPLALTMLRKRKVNLQVPKIAGPGKLDRLFQKVEELESAA